MDNFPSWTSWYLKCEIGYFLEITLDISWFIQVWLRNIPDFIYFDDNISNTFVKSKDWKDFDNFTVVDTEAELSNFAGRSTEAEIEKQMLFQ